MIAILRDCGVLIAITMLCWGMNAVVGLVVYFSLPNGYTADQMAATNVQAMELLMTLGGLYLFANPAALLASVVVRVLTRLHDFPHQFSGGMRQRVLIAMALACSPRLLIADEPTTALDVTVQAQILALLHDLQQQLGMAVPLITHDMGIVAESTDRVMVMYAGQIVEQASTVALFEQRLHPYTEALLACVPRLDSVGKATLSSIPGQPPNPSDFPPGCRFARAATRPAPRAGTSSLCWRSPGPGDR